MEVVNIGRTQLKVEALKGVKLDQLVKDHKRLNPIELTKVWEKYNGKVPKKKKKAPSKEG